MELVNSKNKTLCFLKNNIDLYDIFITILSVCVTFIHDAFMFNPVTNGKFEEQGKPIVSKVLGYIPFK